MSEWLQTIQQLEEDGYNIEPEVPYQTDHNGNIVHGTFFYANPCIQNMIRMMRNGTTKFIQTANTETTILTINKPIKVVVFDIHNRRIDWSLMPGTTYAQLKKKIAKVTQIPAHLFALLDSGKHIEHYGLAIEETTLRVTMGLRGGMIKTNRPSWEFLPSARGVKVHDQNQLIIQHIDGRTEVPNERKPASSQPVMPRPY